ncbi:MAG: hypothetical protein KatS3mg021_1323 [Fimbriimonadales bacterium]|nr:MAG: hypothetical protein KatS3mg021_1323 [Fimbriimonadales bacterium]
MKTVRLSVPAGEVNLPLCVRTGQVFRWYEIQGVWAGMANDALLIVNPEGNRWSLSAVGGEPIALFTHLFRMEVDLKSVQVQLIRRDSRWEQWGARPARLAADALDKRGGVPFLVSLHAREQPAAHHRDD